MIPFSKCRVYNEWNIKSKGKICQGLLLVCLDFTFGIAQIINLCNYIVIWIRVKHGCSHYDLILIVLWSNGAKKKQNIKNNIIIWRCWFTGLTCRGWTCRAIFQFHFISLKNERSRLLLYFRSYLTEILKVLVENSLDYWYDIRESLENVTPETDIAQSSREDTVSARWRYSDTHVWRFFAS